MNSVIGWRRSKRRRRRWLPANGCRVRRPSCLTLSARRTPGWVKRSIATGATRVPWPRITRLSTKRAISATGWSTARRRPLSGRLATAKRRRVSKMEGDGEARRRQGLFILRPGGAAHVHFHRQQADTREGIRQRLLLVIDRGRHAFGAVGQAGERFQPDSLIQPGGG